MGRGWFSITNIDLLIPTLKTTAKLNRHRHLIISVILAKARIQLLVQRVSQLRRLTRVSLPIWIHSFNLPKLPIAFPYFQLLLPLDCIGHEVVVFVPD